VSSTPNLDYDLLVPKLIENTRLLFKSKSIPLQKEKEKENIKKEEEKLQEVEEEEEKKITIPKFSGKIFESKIKILVEEFLALKAKSILH
jgi:hypothetical protein